MKTYGMVETAQILEIKYARLNEWIRGYFQPLILSDGHKIRTAFSVDDLYRLAIFRLLVEFNYDRKTAAQACYHYPDMNRQIVIQHFRAGVTITIDLKVLKKSIDQKIGAPAERAAA